MPNARPSSAWPSSPSTGWSSCSARAAVNIRRNARPDPPDRYGRTLARVLVDGEDVGCLLIKERYARHWTGRREDWCASLDERKPAEAMLSCAVTY
jgi:endonuclease YncB( thermonuclease family)